MISVRFFQRQGKLSGVTVSGHAGYGEYGRDIVCASVTSALQLTANGITEILKAPCDVRMETNRISLTLDRPGELEGEAVHFLQALQLHLTVLAEDYPNTITILVSEV